MTKLNYKLELRCGLLGAIYIKPSSYFFSEDGHGIDALKYHHDHLHLNQNGNEVLRDSFLSNIAFVRDMLGTPPSPPSLGASWFTDQCAIGQPEALGKGRDGPHTRHSVPDEFLH